MEESNRRIVQSLMEIQRHESRTSGMFCHEAGALDSNKEGGPESLRGGGILSYFSVGCWSKENIHSWWATSNSYGERTGSA